MSSTTATPGCSIRRAEWIALPCAHSDWMLSATRDTTGLLACSAAASSRDRVPSGPNSHSIRQRLSRFAKPAQTGKRKTVTKPGWHSSLRAFAQLAPQQAAIGRDLVEQLR
ncbi:hypothetical protein [Streptomyces sp. NPDC048508]|uniref:hypothetical protein n=1 Tax=Streptomyces sp. NPDC048508 TaxID=3365561 RepID=UPI0037215EA6